MDAAVVDTDVFSFFFKGDTRAGAYANDVRGIRLCLSFMSVAELTRWAISHNWGAKRLASLEQSIRRCVVLPYDAEMAECWARIAVERTRAGKPISCGDCWIAAGALRHGIPLITHNAKHFEGIAALRVISRA